MYFRLLRPVIEDAIASHVSNTGLSQDAVFGQIYNHMTETSAQYKEDKPRINYGDPLCRIGYLHRHAAANAALFEKVLSLSDEASLILRQSAQETLNVISMGGGPGTELLGLVKYYLLRPTKFPPRKINFTVIDSVMHWSETWTQLSEATEDELRSILAEDDVEPTAIPAKFLPFDIFDQSQYQALAGQFKPANLIVFNYIFSENKTRLDEARQAMEELAKLTSDDCLFVVIDRLEGNRQFNDEVAEMFGSVFGKSITYHPIGGSLDTSEDKAELGELLLEKLKWPRLTYRTGLAGQDSVFWFEVKRS